MIYLDTTATTKPNEEVIKTYQKVLSDFWYNPSSPYTVGLKANNLFQDSINHIKKLINTPNHNIVFTQSATISNNLAIFGITNNYQNKQMKVITSKIEHPSVFNPFKSLEEKGFDVVYLNVDECGIINLEELKKEINQDTLLVSIMWVNNIIGTIEPIEEVIKIVKQYPRCRLHVDLVQGFTKLSPNFNFSDIDLFSVSMHKIEGLKGCGILGFKENINLGNHLIGSSQQLGINPGTIDLANAVSAAKAIRLSLESKEESYEKVQKLNKYLRQQLSIVDGIYINSPKQNVSPYILNISIPKYNAETIMHYLEQKEIYVAVGSACNSKIKKPEKTVLAVTNDEQRATTSIRISLSKYISINDLDTLVNELKNFINSRS